MAMAEQDQKNAEQDLKIADLMTKLGDKEKEVQYLENMFETKCNKVVCGVKKLSSRVTKLEIQSKSTGPDIDSPYSELLEGGVQRNNVTGKVRTSRNQGLRGHSDRRSMQKKKTTNDPRRRTIQSPVGFTANLQVGGVCRITHAFLTQTMKFNQILTNMGNHYSIHTGAFTAPLEGLYLFHYAFATGWESEKLWLRLMVDGVMQNGGTANSLHPSQDVQGGNVALLHLQAGQSVWVEVFYINDVHIYGCYGFTSFTGVLLYAF